MGNFQLYFEMIGAVAFAVSGAALGIRKGMDLFGVAMMGMTTAVGGGILRDVMLGQTPPAALRDPMQALVAIAVSVLVFYIWRRKADIHNKYAEAVLLVADSIGLGIFRPRRGHRHTGGLRGQLVPGAVSGHRDRCGRRRTEGRVLHGAALHLHEAHLRLRVPGRGGGMSGAVAAGHGTGHAGRLRRNGGAAHLRRRVPVELSQGVKRIEKGTA